MATQVTILADSVAPNGSRLISFECIYPARIHWDVMTHRMFSRNAMSTRAIPWKRMRKWILADPYVPLHWGRNRKGMIPGGDLTGWRLALAKLAWHSAKRAAVLAADVMDRCGCHKSLVNATVIPWMHMRVVITSNYGVGLSNWWNLRLHHAAAPEMQQLAKRMAEAANASTPRQLKAGEWHLIYLTDDERRDWPIEQQVRVSAARAARTSYATFEGDTPEVAADLGLFDRLVGEDPKHASPPEHQAEALRDTKWSGSNPSTNGNLGPGWYQHRKMIKGECATAESFSLDERLALYGDRDFLLEDPR